MQVKLFLLLALLAFATGAPALEEEEEEIVDDGAHSEEEVQEARGEFDSIDLDGDGAITVEEIKAMPEVPEEEEIVEFFETYDLDGDGSVTFNEIIDADQHLREADTAEDAEQ